MHEREKEREEREFNFPYHRKREKNESTNWVSNSYNIESKQMYNKYILTLVRMGERNVYLVI